MQEPPPGSRPTTILVVDDGPENLTLVCELLAPRYAVKAALSGERALRLAADGPPPDLILLDVMMPEMDGYETCRRLREGPAGNTPIIFLSALSAIDERMQGYASGGDDYLCKPFDPPELLAKIERQLQAVALRRRLAQQLDEVTDAVLSSADMAGELGVVLDFQRHLPACADVPALAQALFDALAAFGLDACLRFTTRAGSTSLNGRGPCSALERSILDHIQAQGGRPRIQPFGQHSSFHFGSVLLFVRNLPMSRGAEMDAAESDHHGRAIDNLALLLEGACARVAAFDSEIAVRDLQAIRRLVGVTGDTLADLSTRNRAQTEEVQRLLERLVEDVEGSFISLGLNDVQEEYLGNLVRQSMGSVLQTLARSQESEQILVGVIDQLYQTVT
jgi:CheY-like chemotaxis protein